VRLSLLSRSAASGARAPAYWSMTPARRRAARAR